MSSDAMPIDNSSFKDRKTGLVVFGILEILGGVFLALAVPMMLGVAMMGPAACRMKNPATTAANQKCAAPPVDVKMMLPAAMMYAVGAAWWISMGIGSMHCRRWACSLTLLSAWLWLIAGIIGTIFAVVLFAPAMYGQLPKGGNAPPAAVILATMLGFNLLFFVVLPTWLVWFYGSKHVKATVEHWDPQVRWTDRCPLPVLAVSLMAGVGGLSSLAFSILGVFGLGLTTTVPFCGIIVTGATATIVQLCFAILLGYIAWGSYKLSLRAWWIAVIFAIFAGVSAVLNAFCLSPMELYEKMNMPAAQLEAMQKFGAAGQHWTMALGALWSLVALGYLLWIKRFFRSEQAASDDVRLPPS